MIFYVALSRDIIFLQIIGDVRGRGMFFGIDLVKNRETREPHPAAAEHILSILKEVTSSNDTVWKSSEYLTSFSEENPASV